MEGMGCVLAREPLRCDSFCAVLLVGYARCWWVHTTRYGWLLGLCAAYVVDEVFLWMLMVSKLVTSLGKIKECIVDKSIMRIPSMTRYF